ncbi:MAG: protein kinase, partial [Deltaproteobacteria bacterium]|nr:protein kinase [Deltaproteobacteria bacterium]
KNIVHRDMKPENIFVTVTAQNEDIPKLLDFGIAKVAGNDGNNNLTKTGTIFGTPFYMAPEQALGNNVDARTDIYAVGVIMYEVFSGELPFKGESFMGILTQHITTQPQPVQNVAAKNGRTLPAGLAELIMRCMAKDPNQRHSTMDELVGELVTIYRGIAGAGMSTYMEAFGGQPSSGRMPVPTPPPMIGGYHPPQPPPVGGHAPPHTTPHGMPQVGPPHGHGPPSGPTHAVTGGLYDSGSSVVHVPKKSKAALWIIIIAVLAIGGGVAAFVIMSQKDEPSTIVDAGSDPKSDASIVADNKDADNGTKIPTTDTKDAAASAGADADTKLPDPPDAAVAATPDAAVVEPDAGVTAPPPDAAVAVATVKVKIFLKSPAVPFEAFEGTTKLFDGPDSLEITPGTPRTITLKVRGYKPLNVTVTGKEKDAIVRATLKPEPLDCTAALQDPRNAACVKQYCKTHAADAKCTTTVVVPPPTLDCAAVIKEPKNKACVKQYCKFHPTEPRCDAE